MPVLSHLYHLFNAEQCQAYIYPFAQSLFNILNFKLPVEGSAQPLPL